MNNIRVRDNDELDDDSDGSEIGGDRDEQPDDKLVAQQRLNNKAQQDWNYLKQTMGGGNKGKGGNWKDQHNQQNDRAGDFNYQQQVLQYEEDLQMKLQEKPDTILEKEEELISQHMYVIKDTLSCCPKRENLSLTSKVSILTLSLIKIF